MIARIKGIKKVRAKGHMYYYHRATNTRLPGRPGTTEFMDAITALNRKVELAVRPGTLGDLIASYRASPEFTGTAAETQATYQKVFDYLKPLGGMPLINIDRKFLYQVRDKTVVARKRYFANYMIAVLRMLFNWGMKREFVDRNPAVSVDKIKKPKNAKVVNRPWRLEELNIVLAEAPPHLQVPIAIGAYTGLREGDTARVSWRAYDGSAFETRQQKTGNPVWIRAHYRLREILDRAPHVSPLIVVGARGKPYSPHVLKTAFFELIRKLVKAGKVEPGLSFHGLRHTLATLLAEAGCDPPTIASVLGQQSTKMAEHYSRNANRKHLADAAIGRMEDQDRLRPRGGRQNTTGT
jgi:integrase